MSNQRFPQFRKKSGLMSQKELSRRMANAAADVYLALSIAILAECFGFGEKRICRFVEHYHELAESLGTGTDDLDTIRKNIKEIFNVEV